MASNLIPVVGNGLVPFLFQCAAILSAILMSTQIHHNLLDDAMWSPCTVAEPMVDAAGPRSFVNAIPMWPSTTGLDTSRVAWHYTA